MDRLDRAYGALVGGAIGDAIGDASFVSDPPANSYCVWLYPRFPAHHRRKCNLYHGNLQAGEITDDTMESVIITSEVLLNHGEVFRKRLLTKR